MSSVTGQDHQRLLPASLEARLIGTFGRATGCALLLGLGAIWMSLISWSIADPSLSHTTGGAVRNALGAPGAIIADLLLQTLGLAATVALLPPMLWSLELVTHERFSAAKTRATYFPLAVLGAAGALSALPLSETWPITHGYGGILGDVLFNFAASIFGIVSSDQAGLAAGILFTGICFSALAQSVGVTRRDLLALLPKKRLRAAPVPAWEHTPEAVFPAPQRARAGEPRLSRSWGFTSLTAALAATRDRARDAYARSHRAEPVLDFGPAYDPHAQAYAAHAHEAAPAPFEPMPATDAMHPDAEPHMAAAHAHAPHYDDDVVTEDPSLTVSSRAMAARFAPASARMHGQAQPPIEPPHVEATQMAEPPIFRAPERAAPPRTSEPVRKPKPAAMPAASARRRAEPVFKRPPPSMLKRAPASKTSAEFSQTVLRGTARLLEDVLADFGVKGEVRDIKPGPVVTLFELEPARGTKATRIMALADDIARSMSATSARVAVIPGRNAIGIELPNARRDMVGLRELLESPQFASADGVLPLALGRSIGGEPVVADLARMPHLLVAGTTGSGKSVGVNAMILSILFRHTPEECRFLMIDPKMLELSVYNDIPHLLTPVVTDPQKAVAALSWVVSEMEERYKRMSRLAVRNIEAFNARVKGAKQRGEQLARTVQTGFDPRTGQPIFEREEMDLDPMAYIVVVVDEFADLMITAGKDIETAVQRLAQKARAAGIHLVMATQRPSVDIITGTIKANFPTRISFKVASKIDSRTILNEQGAEQLLGQGDMLFTLGAGQMVRVHGPFVSDEEVEAVAAYLRTQGAPRYVNAIAETRIDADEGTVAGNDEGGDSLYDRAVAVVLRDRKASTSYIQRRLSIGYNRAADLIERMEQDGLISAPNHTGRREILAGEPPNRAA
jgi:S-DNA-T family DNA segregation ATPase FtsK/SpoIIIE